MSSHRRLRTTSIRLLLWGLFILPVFTPTSGQIPHDLLQGAVNEIPADFFACGLGTCPCDLSYRMYSEIDPSEVNGPANPVDGCPRYRSIGGRYVSDPQVTQNFPNSWAAGPGNEWYIVWDGVTDPLVGDHAGWYGTQSQVVNFGEIGNILEFNCLPIRSMIACFGALDSRVSNDTRRPNGTLLTHLGGISPIPCPQLIRSNKRILEYTWEQATNSNIQDSASNAVTGYDLYILGDPVSAATEADLAAARLVASVPRTQTSVALDRDSLPGDLDEARRYLAAIKLRYASGKQSLYFSCNSCSPGGGEDCFDGVDNNCDGKVDLRDPICCPGGDDDSDTDSDSDSDTDDNDADRCRSDG